jgi:hypothetical protein
MTEYFWGINANTDPNSNGSIVDDNDKLVDDYKLVVYKFEANSVSEAREIGWQMYFEEFPSRSHNIDDYNTDIQTYDPRDNPNSPIRLPHRLLTP